MSALAPLFEAEGKRLALFAVGSDWGCTARDLGRMLGYAADGGKLVDKIGSAWSDEFVEGVDFTREPQPTEQVGSHPTRTGGRPEAITESVIASRTAPIILTRSGINLACILTRKPLGKAIRRWLASDVMIQIADTGAYAPQPPALTLPEADLSALTEQISIQARALDLLTAQVAALTALFAPAPQPAPKLSHSRIALESLPVEARALVPVIERLFERTDTPGLTAEEVTQMIRPGPWTKWEKSCLTHAVHSLGIWSGSVRWRKCYALRARPGRPAAADLTDLMARVATLELRAPPAPTDGIHPLGAHARVRIKGGVPVEVYAGRIIPDGRLDVIEADFAAAFPGFHLRPSGYTNGRPRADWASEPVWDYDWNRNAWPSGHEHPPKDAGMIAKACRGKAPTEAHRDRNAKVVNDAKGRPIAVEWKGNRTQQDLSEMDAEMKRLCYRTKPWRRTKDGWRAEIVH